MSRAFLKEGDGDTEEDLPDRPVSSLANYVTPDGLQALEERMRELGDRRRALASKPDRERSRKLKEVERDLRYFESRVETAIKIDPQQLDTSEVRIGAEIELDNGAHFRIVGEDQADGKNLICWAAPMAAALLGAKQGTKVSWQGENGLCEATLKALNYPA
jgi:transcription elongation factor GreB